MYIVFKHPCNENLVFKRKVPNKGTTKKRIDYDENSFDWHFTQCEYYFILKYNNGNIKLSVSSGNPNDYLDYSEIECELIK